MAASSVRSSSHGDGVLTFARSVSAVGKEATSATFLLTRLLAKEKPPSRMLPAMRRLSALLLLLVVVACKQEQVAEKPAATPAAAPDTSYQDEIRKWQTDRAERLKKEDSWLTLVGLDWLKEGDNKAPAGT